MKPQRFRPRLPSPHAFSLIETVLAIAIIAFALVGIMGLFPAAIDAAVSSQRETQIALISRSIFSDLSSNPGTNTFVSTSKTDPPSGITVNLSATNTYYLGYDSDGSIVGEVSSSAYAGGTDSVAFIASVDVAPVEPAEEGISRVTVSVEAPAGAPEERRRRYPFATLMGQDVPQLTRIPSGGGQPE